MKTKTCEMRWKPKLKKYLGIHPNEFSPTSEEMDEALDSLENLAE